jgi:DNA-binding transcriptional LysR family regulator
VENEYWRSPITRRNEFKLRDWNDARILIACAEQGSFAAAAAVLKQDQTTVSRRIGQLEAAVGRPLFRRRRSGAMPTVVGLALVARARAMAAAVADIENAISGLEEFPSPEVMIAASEGLLAYTLKPTLLGDAQVELPFDRRLMARPLPPLAFTTDFRCADIAVEALDHGRVPRRHGSFHTRRVGTMRFVPMASRIFFDRHRAVHRFDELARSALLNIGTYGGIRGLDPWHALVAEAEPDIVTTGANTPEIQGPMLAGQGVAVLPPYAALYDPRLCVIDMPVPDMSVDLWLTAHADSLREPAVRHVYDTLATLFRRSTWFR